MGIIETIFSGFNKVIESVTGGLSTGITHLLWKGVADEAGTITYAQANGLSDFASLAFTLLGLSLATGVAYLVVRLVRR